MRHEEQHNRSRNPREEHPDVRRRSQGHPHEQNFNDFKSRWEEPVPLNRNREPRYYDERERSGPRTGDFGREEWRPNEQRGQFRQQGPQDQQYRQQPNWRRSDVAFDGNNQHADDRWSQDDLMPHPHRRRISEEERIWRERNRR